MDIHTLSPIAGKDYPQNWNAFLDWFSTEDACLAYLEKLRWPEGFVCPSCALAGKPHRANRGRLICRHCRYQSSVTAGTIFSKTSAYSAEPDQSYRLNVIT
jgi:transposase-like protein